jgi:hypothetical protein
MYIAKAEVRAPAEPALRLECFETGLDDYLPLVPNPEFREICPEMYPGRS